jgi:hypothetical protein
MKDVSFNNGLIKLRELRRAASCALISRYSATEQRTQAADPLTVF